MATRFKLSFRGFDSVSIGARDLPQTLLAAKRAVDEREDGIAPGYCSVTFTRPASATPKPSGWDLTSTMATDCRTIMQTQNLALGPGSSTRSPDS